MPLWLLALLLNAFPFGLSAAAPKAPAELVYCPLTKRLQPVKAPPKNFRKNSLDDICAGKDTKNSFLNEIFSSRNLAAVNHLNDQEFEDLVLAFSRIGKAAFQNLPPPPDLPRQSALKASFAVAGFSRTGESKCIWKPNAASFSFAENPRPPTPAAASYFEPRNRRELETASRPGAPRAPPFFS